MAKRIVAALVIAFLSTIAWASPAVAMDRPHWVQTDVVFDCGNGANSPLFLVTMFRTGYNFNYSLNVKILVDNSTGHHDYFGWFSGWEQPSISSGYIGTRNGISKLRIYINDQLIYARKGNLTCKRGVAVKGKYWDSNG